MSALSDMHRMHHEPMTTSIAYDRTHLIFGIHRCARCLQAMYIDSTTAAFTRKTRCRYSIEVMTTNKQSCEKTNMAIREM